MATVNKDLADKLVAKDGYYADDPRVMPMKDFLQLCEQKLIECRDLSNAPIELSHDHARTWMVARGQVLLWVLEMMKVQS